MSKAETAVSIFGNNRNCAQAVLTAYAGDYGLDQEQALRLAAGFGGGLGRIQDVCGAVSGAVMVLGLRSGFGEGDGRDKINEVYTQTRHLIGEFTRQKGTIKCRELLSGCDLSSDEGKKIFKEQNLRERCREAISLVCELLDR
jgi:C_GCAxxG_C_C family probable redox protein